MTRFLAPYGLPPNQLKKHRINIGFTPTIINQKNQENQEIKQKINKKIEKNVNIIENENMEIEEMSSETLKEYWYDMFIEDLENKVLYSYDVWESLITYYETNTYLPVDCLVEIPPFSNIIDDGMELYEQQLIEEILEKEYEEYEVYCDLYCNNYYDFYYSETLTKFIF